MTVRQRKFVKGKMEGKSDQAAALSAGYRPSVARVAGNKLANKPDVRAAFLKALERAGITDELLAERMREGLNATETKLFAFEGKITDRAEVSDMAERWLTLELAARIMNLNFPHE